MERPPKAGGESLTIADDFVAWLALDMAGGWLATSLARIDRGWEDSLRCKAYTTSILLEARVI